MATKTAKKTVATKRPTSEDGYILLKSMTPKAIWGDNVTTKDIGKVIANISGVIEDYFTVNTKYGESVGFKGFFLGQNPESGEVFESNAVFLPANATEQIQNQLADSEDDTLKIKLGVSVQESDKNASGIAYICDLPETEARKSAKLLAKEAFKSEFLALKG